MRHLSPRKTGAAGSWARSPRSPFTLAAPFLALAVGLFSAPADAQGSSDPCKGRWVKRLGGPHAVSRVPMKTLADLQKRLPELEATMRDIIARDPSVGPGVADAIFDAIRNGKVTERKMARNESMKWMIYQPKKGEFGVVMNPCVQLDRDYDAFEIVMDENAVLGPIDPQLGDFPAGSILKVVENKPIHRISDATLVLADQSSKAIAQVTALAEELLAGKLSPERASRVATRLASGTWTHDFPITADAATELLGLPVSTAIPEEVFRVTSLYRQAQDAQPSVFYLPGPRYKKKEAEDAGEIHFRPPQ